MIRFFLTTTFILLHVVIGSGQVQDSGRRVSGGILVSDSMPTIKLKIDPALRSVGSQTFTLYDRAKVNQFFFVEAKGKKISRMIMIQFEGFLPGVAGSYDYNEPKTVEIGGEKYFSNAESIPDVPAALQSLPGSDIARAAEWLGIRGFSLPKSLRYQRFVRTVDAEKRHEIIILYVEDTEPIKAGDLSKRALKLLKKVK